MPSVHLFLSVEQGAMTSISSVAAFRFRRGNGWQGWEIGQRHGVCGDLVLILRLCGVVSSPTLNPDLVEVENCL